MVSVISALQWPFRAVMMVRQVASMQISSGAVPHVAASHFQ